MSDGPPTMRGLTLENASERLFAIAERDFATLDIFRRRIAELARRQFGDKSQHVLDVLNVQTSPPDLMLMMHVEDHSAEFLVKRSWDNAVLELSNAIGFMLDDLEANKVEGKRTKAQSDPLTMVEALIADYNNLKHFDVATASLLKERALSLIRVYSQDDTRLYMSVAKADLHKPRGNPTPMDLVLWDQTKRIVLNALGGLRELLLAEQAATRPLQVSRPSGNKIFIGHGGDKTWIELQQFLTSRLQLEVVEFNTVSSAGVGHQERLGEMLATSRFAFIVATAEDSLADGSTQARPNVIHEIGLFQGRLGFKKAIVVLEEGCDEFSNIKGLGQIRFAKGHLDKQFEEIRKVLEREGIIKP